MSITSIRLRQTFSMLNFSAVMSQFCSVVIFIIKIKHYLKFMYVYYPSTFGKAYYTYLAVHLLCYLTPAASRPVPSFPAHLPTNRSNTPLHFRPPSQHPLFKHTTNLSQHRTRFQLLHTACSDIVGTLNFINLTFRGPCIVIYSYNKNERDAKFFLKFILV
jgi:hypothetical protein